MSPDFFVRQAMLSDLAEVLALDRSIAEAPHWTEAMYCEYVEQPAGSIQVKKLFVAVQSGCILGFAAVTALGDEAELESIAVSQKMRRLGVGVALLVAAQVWASAQGAGTLRLEVRVANVQAQTFYKAQGFLEAGLRYGYYRDPPDDGLLMLRELHRRPSRLET